ncbi:MAG: lipoyl synthase [Candidatus Saganbacteria bacterium]|nr:lipoyl synthase [Candidatus Saganbacteria bacterium]
METLPQWLIKRTPKSQNIREIHSLLDDDSVHTVCESAKCPNIGECYLNRTVTFMILGNICTRNCGFCAVSHGHASPPDEDEPKKVADAAKRLGLKYVVITSVTRDDLEDGGADQFVRTIREIRSLLPGTKIEVLVPDFKGNEGCIGKIIDIKPNIINHNLETVKRLYPAVRSQADYGRSLSLLRAVKDRDPSLYTKSGIMLGLGETKEEVIALMEDLREVDCDILTIGQYLQPSKEQVEVLEYIKPSDFDDYKDIGERMGFKKVFSGPFVRSSYKASEAHV